MLEDQSNAATMPVTSPSESLRSRRHTAAQTVKIPRPIVGVVVMCLTFFLFCPANASAGMQDYLRDLYERMSAWLGWAETAATERLVSPEEFSTIMPELVRKRGVYGIFGREVRNLGDNPEVFTVQTFYLNSPDSGRPLILWIDKIEGSKMTRYADLDSDGILDGVTFDGMPVLSDAAIRALATGDRQMAGAVFRGMKDQASRYQPMYQADYSKVIRLALARYPQD
jgi:hypothetical protein